MPRRPRQRQRRDRYFDQTFKAYRRHGMSPQEATYLANRGIRVRSALGKTLWRSRERAIKIVRADNPGETKVEAMLRIQRSIREDSVPIDRRIADIMKRGASLEAGVRRLTEDEWKIFRFYYKPAEAV